MRRPSAPRPQQCHPSQAGPDSPKPRLPNGTNRAPGGCSLKGDRKRSSGAHTSPNGPKLRKATEAVFAPNAPGRSLAKSGWAAPGSLRLLLSRESSEPESHSLRVLLHGEARFNVRRPSSPMPQQYSPSEAGPICTKDPTPQRHQPSSWALQSAKGQETFLAEQYQPHRAFAQESNASRFRTQTAAGRREKRGWAASGSLALLLCCGSLEPETHTPCVLLCGEA